jgi:hypothetical protein
LDYKGHGNKWWDEQKEATDAGCTCARNRYTLLKTAEFEVLYRQGYHISITRKRAFTTDRSRKR